MATQENVENDGLPLDSGGVFTVSARAVIDAEISKVWSILIDFPGYTDWNPFVRSQRVVDAAGRVLDDQTAREGRHLLLTVHMPPTMDAERDRPTVRASRDVITTVDHARHRLAWTSAEFPPWALRGERWQALSTDADGRTLYVTRMVLRGPLAYAVRLLYGGTVAVCFEAVAAALKRHAEK